MDRLTPKQRHECMSHIRSNNTTIEVLLRKALWQEGIRYRKNYNKLPGKPDIAITKYKIAIFCDGELWHGKDWETKKEKIETNKEYWIHKIEYNMARDNKNDKVLEEMGWVVLHFWGQDIEKHIADCVNQVKEAIYDVKYGIYKEKYKWDDIMLVAEDSIDII